MDGSITKRSDGRWQGAVDIPNITGKRQRKYVYGATRMECRRKMNEIIEQIESQSMLNPEKVTFKSYAQTWLDVYCHSLSPTTKEGYRKSVLVYADKYIGDAILARILTIHIQDMINSLGDTHSRKTCKNILGSVRSVFNYAVTNHLIKTNPCIGIKLPQEKEKYQYYIYTEDEYNKLLDASAGTEMEIPILLGGLCGMRLSEIMGLMWSDIDFEKRTINIQRANVFVGAEIIEKAPKTNTSYRKIVVPAYVIERLKSNRSIGYVVSKKDGSAEHGGNFRLRFSMFLERNNLPKTRFHDLRHFAATMMLKHGTPDKISSQYLGHSNINMTQKYQHIIDNMESRPATALDSIVQFRKRDVKMDVKTAEMQ